MTANQSNEGGKGLRAAVVTNSENEDRGGYEVGSKHVSSTIENMKRDEQRIADLEIRGEKMKKGIR